MARLDRLAALFPLVFAALVLQKTYLVSKQALVPSVVRSEAELVEANSKLGVIAGLTGFVAVIPAGLLQLTPIKGWGDAVYSRRCCSPSPSPAPPGCRPTSSPPAPAAGRAAPAALDRAPAGGVAMVVLRAAVGFMFFLLAFWLRTQTAGAAWFGVAVGLSALGSMAGNAISPRAARARCARSRCWPARWRCRPSPASPPR